MHLREPRLSEFEIENRIMLFPVAHVIIIGATPLPPLLCGKSRLKCIETALFLFVQIFGPESSGKTTLALHAIAEVQVW